MRPLRPAWTGGGGDWSLTLPHAQGHPWLDGKESLALRARSLEAHGGSSPDAERPP